MIVVNQDKEMKLRALLIKIGISANIKGFRYILDAIEILEKQQIHTNMTTVYELVGEKQNTTRSAVERAIRHAINQAYTNKKMLKEIYYSKPDNSALLYDLVFNFDVFKNIRIQENNKKEVLVEPEILEDLIAAGVLLEKVDD